LRDVLDQRLQANPWDVMLLAELLVGVQEVRRLLAA
jgi:hypothetical protein